jgi:hypothetical protein
MCSPAAANSEYCTCLYHLPSARQHSPAAIVLSMPASSALPSGSQPLPATAGRGWQWHRRQALTRCLASRAPQPLLHQAALEPAWAVLACGAAQQRLQHQLHVQQHAEQPEQRHSGVPCQASQHEVCLEVSCCCCCGWLQGCRWLLVAWMCAVRCTRCGCAAVMRFTARHTWLHLIRISS